ncbi:hypothetical protein F4802DRAFT_619772 [Xylaria palmicola]|nr:hypothetical protein F4802DRAFT_619772 [Xylaria palmicola]
MDRLPVELRQMTLGNLDSVRALRNAALSCKILFNDLKDAEELITGEVFVRQVGYDVLAEALVVEESRSLGLPCIEKGKRFAEANFAQRKPAPARWSLADAWPLAVFHEKVSYLARQAARESLEKQPRLLAMGAPSSTELRRFERALYRFQLYCNVVGRLPALGHDELQDIFFAYFSNWENEQLACIHEHLLRVISRPFNYLVDHDVGWGCLEIPYILVSTSDYAQGIMVEGIETIYRLSRASDYAQWHSLLSRGGVPLHERVPGPACLAYGLRYGANRVGGEVTAAMLEQDEGLRAYFYGREFYEDPDPGPASMWEWVNRESFPDESVANWNTAALRLWAFPFWDLARVEGAGLLGNPTIPAVYFWADSIFSPDPELDQYNTRAREEYLRESRRERVIIGDAGGTGFYSPGDTSQIDWDSGTRWGAAYTDFWYRTSGRDEPL